MKHVKRGEIWLVDLGMARKVRPVLALSIGYEDHEKAIVTYVVRTTSVRGSRFEVEHRARNFKPGAFDGQSISTDDVSYFIRRLAIAPDEVLIKVENTVRHWLAL
ncbi:MAG: mRNA interferase MazF [Verrucomicrobiales bacterium]|jgi:mRNA interferase MazF